MASYYKIINGIRYDRSLLELGESLTKGHGDGRISRKDAEQLWQQAQDGKGLTDTEKRTLEYLLEHLKWTETGEAWITEQLDGVLVSFEKGIQQIVQEGFDLTGLQVDIPEALAEQQEEYGGNVTFQQALAAALYSFLNDGSDYESPRLLVQEVHGIFPDNSPQWQEQLDQKLREYMRQGVLTLIPEFDPNDEDLDFNPPENGESIQENWVFSLSLPTFSDHIYWAIVDRAGQAATYNYGFN